MKYRIVLLYLALLTSCEVQMESNPFTANDSVVGKGDLVTKDRTVSAFTSVENTSFANVHIVANSGSSNSCKVAAQENIIEYITFKTENNRLIISTKENSSISTSKSVDIYLTTATLTSASNDGSGNIDIDYNAENEKTIFDINGSGNINVSGLGTNELESNIHGSGNIEYMKSIAKHADFEIDGSGNIEAADLSSTHVKAQINGSGDISTKVVETLDAQINGSGNVNYTGSPTVTSQVNGSGEIKRAN